jgi:zeaxanthin glucosyltransferase
MKKILIAMSQHKGHLNPTFRLAHALRAQGHAVVYACEDLKTKVYVQEQGFETVIGSLFLFPNFDYGKKGFEGFIERFTSSITGINTKLAKEQLTHFEKMIQTVQPDLLLLDAFLSYNYMLLKGNKPPVCVLQTMISTYQQPLLPPITTFKMPANNSFLKFRNQVIWQLHPLSMKLKNYLFFEMSLWRITQKIAKNRGIDIDSQAKEDKVFHAGLKNVPEIILSPKSFDFKESIALDFQIHAGLMIAEQKSATVNERINNIITNKKEQKLIYCSLGTVSGMHYDNYLDFYKKVIKAFSLKESFQLILSISEGDIKSFGKMPSHIHLFNAVPQRDVLKYADVFITHGGLNSVLEGITAEVPMLTVPLSNRWDQKGNAARVVYHGVGLYAKIKSVQEKDILKSVNNLIENKDFKVKTKQLKAKFEADDNLDKVIQLIEDQMNTSQKAVQNTHFQAS